MPSVVNPGGRGGPLIQAPFGQMTGRGGGGGGGGYGSSMFVNPYRRRLPGEAARIDPNLRFPQEQPEFDPYEEKPYGRGEQEPQPRNDYINIYGGYPGVHPAMAYKDAAPRASRSALGLGRGTLQNLSDSYLRLRLGRGGGAQRLGSQGFGEGYQDSDALRRLLMARLGDGGGF